VPQEGSEAHAKLAAKAAPPDTLGGLAVGEGEAQAPAVRYWRPIP
jgi:hypothetical protein